MDLNIGLHSDVAGIGREEWNALVDHCPDSTIFQRHEWLQAWIDSFGADSLQQHIVTARRGGQLVGVAPLLQGSHVNAPSSRRSVHFLGAGHADYLTFPALGGSVAIVEALLDAIGRLIPQHTSIELTEVPQSSTLSRCLAKRAERRASGVLLEPPTVCPRLRISGNEAALAAILGKQSIRRSAKRLRQMGAVSVEHLLDHERIEPLLPAFFDMHVARCRLTQYSSLFERHGNRRFYGELVRRFAGTGLLVFTIVRVDEQVVAQHFGLRSGGDLLWYKPTFDVRYAKCSPGETLLADLIRYAHEQGFAALDFTRGDEPFKARFCSDVRFNNSYLWLRNGWDAALHRTNRAMRCAARAAINRWKSGAAERR